MDDGKHHFAAIYVVAINVIHPEGCYALRLTLAFSPTPYIPFFREDDNFMCILYDFRKKAHIPRTWFCSLTLSRFETSTGFVGLAVNALGSSLAKSGSCLLRRA
jgi:hypothetical protein